MAGNSALPLFSPDSLASLAAAAAAGFGAGSLSFAGLWWSVRRALGRRASGVPIIAGSALRFAFIAAVFWFAARGDSARMLAVLAGFLAAQAAAAAMGVAEWKSAAARGAPSTHGKADGNADGKRTRNGSGRPDGRAE